MAQLVQGWEGAGSGSGYKAVTAHGLVYFGSEGGIEVFPLNCGSGGTECVPLWQTDVGAGDIAVAGHRLFASTGFGVLVYPAEGCGQPVCEPVQTLITDSFFPGPLTVAGDVVVTAADDTYYGYPGLWVFDLSRCSGDPCAAAWKADIGEGTAAAAAVAQGFLYLGTSDGLDVYELAGCGAEFCEPTWTGDPGIVFHAKMTPTVSDGFVYLLSSGYGPELSAFRAEGCGEATCEPTWQAEIQAGFSAGDSLAVAYGRVWVHGYGQINVFSANGCGLPLCDPLWIGETSRDYLRPPFLANGVVYVAASDLGGPNTEINAFSTECDEDVCRPLAVLPTQGEFAYASFVSDGKLVVASAGSDGGAGIVEVYGLP